MRASGFFFYGAVACAWGSVYADASTRSSLLNSLLRPFDAFHSALSSSSSLPEDQVRSRSEEASSLPRTADMSLLDSARTLELLSAIRQKASAFSSHMNERSTVFSNRRFAIVSALFGDEAADQRLKEALGPSGSIYVETPSKTRKNETGPQTTDPRLRSLNEALALHGYPPLPYLPPFLNETTGASGGTNPIEQLLERINSGQGLPEAVINEFSSEEFASFRTTWRLPSTTIPPLNKGLANSPWPISHRNSFAQGSTALPGPDGTRRLTHNFLNRGMVISNPITLFYTANEKYLWGSSWTTIFKVARTKTSLAVVDYVRKPAETVMDDKFHGAYALITQEEVFIVSAGKRLEAYYDAPGHNGDKIMKHPETFDLHTGLQSIETEAPRRRELFRSLCMTHDGHIAWVTDIGRVGIVGRDVKNGSFQRALASVVLGAAKRQESPAKTNKTLSPNGVSGSDDALSTPDEDLQVSNNIACDDRGGIYVVSSKYMHKLEWKDNRLSVSWEEPYDLEPALGGTAPARLGEGSGSTPTLMGTSDRRYVVLTDSAKLMNLVVMDAETGKVEARHPITFGDSAAKETSSEQSVLVHGWRMVIVNNQPTEEAKVSTQFLQYLGSPKSFLAGMHSRETAWSRMREAVSAALPVIVGDAPKGVEQFEFDPDAKRIRTTWVNKNLSIPNGIPTMSAKSQLMYGVGKRCVLVGDAAPLRGMWTLEAVDWWTGVSKFHYNIGVGPMSNSVYAATQVGPNEIITGTAAGIVRIKEA